MPVTREQPREFLVAVKSHLDDDAAGNAAVLDHSAKRRCRLLLVGSPGAVVVYQVGQTQSSDLAASIGMLLGFRWSRGQRSSPAARCVCAEETRAAEDVG